MSTAAIGYMTPPPSPSHKNAVHVIENYLFIPGRREHHVRKILIEKKVNKGLLWVTIS